MGVINSQSGRSYSPLPIDGTLGFPQSFSSTFGGKTYHFFMYVDIEASLLNSSTANLLQLPTSKAFLVVQVEKENRDNTRTIIFLRKVVPNLEYVAENIALTFPTQIVARSNLNGRGDFRSVVVGGIADRWA